MNTNTNPKQPSLKSIDRDIRTLTAGSAGRPSLGLAVRHSNCRRDKTDLALPDWVYERVEGAGIRLVS